MLWIVPLLLTACAGFGSDTPAEVVVQVNESGYTPSRVDVAAGERVRLTLENMDLDEHHLGIRRIALVTKGRADDPHAGHEMEGMETPVDVADLTLHIVAAAGESTTLEFTPTQAGEYEFECVVPGHEETGTLVVSMSR